LNYDTVVEQAAYDLGLSVDYGASRLAGSSKAVRLGGPNAIRLLKLHGSANWAGGGRGRRALVFPSYSDFGTTRTPLIIPPTWRKGDLTAAFGEVWPKAAEALCDATDIVVIGYSLPPTDQHVRHLFTTSLANNPGIHSFRVVNLHWDASANQTITDYETLFEPLIRYKKFQYERTGLDGYLGTFRGGGQMDTIREVT
jgi:hypothetical protein